MVAVIGAGGIGKAIAFALAGIGVAEIRIFDTDRAKAMQLADHRETQQSKCCRQRRGRHARRHRAVNGSPVGMLPNRGTPVPGRPAASGACGSPTRLYAALDAAVERRQGKGREVMIGASYDQAVDAFELFTELKPSAVEMGNALDAVMARRYAKVNAA